jgi:hypothetical protein
VRNLKHVNLVTVILVALFVASLVAKAKGFDHGGYGFSSGR